MSKNNTTIQEDFTLPSKGLMYNKPFDPHIRLRSMTVEDEMRRLSPTKTPYKMMSEIIDSCLIEKLPMSVYDLYLCDYTYLLHKLRTVTYGPDYAIKFTCPKCGNEEIIHLNLDDVKVNEYKKEIENLMTVKLPKTGYTVKLRLQTPRDLDKISQDREEMKKQNPDLQWDPTQLLTLKSLIESIDGGAVDPALITETLKRLPMMDANILSQAAAKLQEKVGLDNIMHIQCSKCDYNVDAPFLYTNEFFGPTL